MFQETVNTIKANLERIKDLKPERLYPQGPSVSFWNSLTPEEIRNQVSQAFDLLNDLRKNPQILDTLSFSQIRSVNEHIEGLINNYNSFISVAENEITTHHFATLEYINTIITNFRSFGIFTELRINPQLKQKLEKLKEVDPLLEKIVGRESEFEAAIVQANEWLKSRQNIDGQALKGQADAFLNRAEEHNSKGWYLTLIKNLPVPMYQPNWWLLLTFVMSTVVFVITYELIKLSQSASAGLSLGMVVLRVSTVLVPGYLTLFSANQYLYHKRLHESYMFKYASLNTMNHLLSTRTAEQQTEILSKGLNVLFSEPSTKESAVKYDSHLVTEMLSILKSQISK